MTLICDQITDDMLLDYGSDGASVESDILNPDVREAIAGHLEGCEACTQRARDVDRLAQVIGSDLGVDSSIPPDFDREMAVKFGSLAREHAAQHLLWRRSLPVLRVAAAAFAVLTIFAAWYFDRSKPTAPPIRDQVALVGNEFEPMNIPPMNATPSSSDPDAPDTGIGDLPQMEPPTLPEMKDSHPITDSRDPVDSEEMGNLNSVHESEPKPVPRPRSAADMVILARLVLAERGTSEWDLNQDGAIDVRDLRRLSVTLAKGEIR